MEFFSSRGAVATDFDGGLEDGADGDEAGQFVRGYGSEAHGSDAAAGGTVGIATELAGSDFGQQVGGDGLGGQGEDAFLGTVGRSGELIDYHFGHIELGKLFA